MASHKYKSFSSSYSSRSSPTLSHMSSIINLSSAWHNLQISIPVTLFDTCGFQFVSAPRFVRGITAALLCYVQRHLCPALLPLSTHHRKKRKFIMCKVSIIYSMPVIFHRTSPSNCLKTSSVKHYTQDPGQATRPPAHTESRAEHPCAADTA